MSTKKKAQLVIVFLAKIASKIVKRMFQSAVLQSCGLFVNIAFFRCKMSFTSSMSISCTTNREAPKVIYEIHLLYTDMDPILM